MTRAAAKSPMIERILAGPVLIDAHAHVGADAAAFCSGNYPYAITAEDFVLRLDLTGVDYAACFPLVYTAYFSLPDFVHNRFVRSSGDLSPIPYGLENERLCQEIFEAMPAVAERLLPFAFFDPGREPEAQVSALESLVARYPVYGLKSATSYLQSHSTELLRGGRCLLDFAARHNLPVTLHTAVIPGDPWANVFEILKVVRARPDVRFALAHTCRFDRRALDEADSLANCFVDFSAFHIHCKLAQQNHAAVASGPDRFPADYTRHAAAMQAIAEAYPETMLWGSDTPGHQFIGRFVDDRGEEHWMHLTCERRRETDEFRQLPDALRDRIGYRNTVRYLFGQEAVEARA
ncbi:MAG: amidohydrolase family protein [Pirellulales bacterium]|nr:amidohydrolase family protein [Pirellulales bacterium]